MLKEKLKHLRNFFDIEKLINQDFTLDQTSQYYTLNKYTYSLFHSKKFTHMGISKNEFVFTKNDLLSQAILTIFPSFGDNIIINMIFYFTNIMNIPSFPSRQSILPDYQALLDAEVTTLQELKNRIAQRDALDCKLGDDYAWRYIQHSCFTEDAEKTKAYMQFLEDIMPEWQRMGDQLNRRLVGFSHLESLDKPYQVYLRSVKSQIALFREENILLQEKDEKLASEYQACRAAMMVMYQGQEMTLQQAGVFLEGTDRAVRKEIYELTSARQLQDGVKVHEILDQLIAIRTQQAKNAGYNSYVSYIYDAKGRFDYTPEDVAQFRDAIKTVVTPLYIEQLRARKEELGIEKLMPYDLAVDPSGLPPLHPFTTGEELTEKTIAGLTQLDTRFGEWINHLNDQGLFDLDSRKGKQPGGYNYPLLGQGVSFVFANVAGTMSDVETMLHECGHALHQCFMEHLPLGIFKEYPSEVAEVASMSMELFSYDMRDQFSLNEEELKRAKKNHLEKIIKTLCRVAIIDEFQHWLYSHEGHTHNEREEARKTIFTAYSGNIIDRSVYPDAFATMRQKQLHIYSHPFYYIEYAIAQLGAIAMWKNYLIDKKQGIENYTNFLAQGYTCPIPEIFKAGGIKFDFSEQYIKELLTVVKEELVRLG